MTLADPNSPSGWSLNEILTSAQLNIIRAGIIAAIDGVNGGVYTLLSKLTINGTGKFELGDKLQYTSRSISRYVPMVALHKTAGWEHSGWWTTTTNTAESIQLPLFMPQGGTLTSVSLSFKGGSGHAALPATMPDMTVIQRAATGTGMTSLGGVIDTSPDVATYQAQHFITVSGLSHVVDNTANNYHVSFLSEFGANAVLGADLMGVLVTCTVTEQTEWGG